MDRNRNHNNSRKLYPNENKRYNYYNNNQNCNYNNGVKSGSNSSYNKGVNDSNAQKDKEWNRNVHNCDNSLDQNMPGIPVNRTISCQSPFVSKDNETHETNALNGCDNGEGDQRAQSIDAIITQLSAIDMTNNKDNQNKSKDKDDSQPKTESQIKSEFVNNEELVFNNRRKNQMIRRNTTGSADNYNRNYNNKRFNRQFINNENNTSFQYNNSNKFYRNNDRINSNHKYESNHQNRDYKPKTYTPSVPSVNSCGANYGDNYGDNSNSLTTPNMYYWNTCDPFMQSFAYLVPNQYPMYSSANQSIGYPLQQTITSNTNESNTQLSIDGKQTEMNKKSAEEYSYSKNTNGNVGPYSAASFVPFQPTPQMPAPPLYFGFINTIVNENGLHLYYFVSQYPPNIVPLPLEIDANGVPILPSNCKIYPIHQ